MNVWLFVIVFFVAVFVISVGHQALQDGRVDDDANNRLEGQHHGPR